MGRNKDHLAIYFPGDKTVRGSVELRKGIKEAIDEMLLEIYKVSSIKFSRNDFIVKSIKFYLAHLSEIPDIKNLIEEMQKEHF